MKTNTKIVIFVGLVSIVLLALQLVTPVNAFAAAGNCYASASKQCISNISYWYDSCGNIQSVAQNCNNTNQVCQSGTCVNKAGTVTTTTTTNTNTGTTYTGTGYIQNYRTNCYGNNVQWFDSRGAVQGIYQNCQAANSCTIGTCQDNACRAQLKCDGSTCAQGSADYTTYCANNVQGTATVNNTTTNNTTNNTTTVNQNGQVLGASTQAKNFAISMFGKKQGGSDWVKGVDAVNGDSIEFLMVIKNISGAPMTSAIVSADLTGNIAYTGNLKIDGIASAGSVTSGIDLGAFPAQATKTVSFTGAVQSTNSQVIQVIGRVTANGGADSDFFTVNLGASAQTAAISNTTTSTSSPFLDFIKKWYLWMIIVIVLIALFVIIFRRLSTNP